MSISHKALIVTACFTTLLILAGCDGRDAGKKSDETANQDVQIGITLASIAYLGKDSDPVGQFKLMAKALQQRDLPTMTQWGLVWGPASYESNLMYIVQGPKTQFGRRYAVVVRGTIESVKSIFEDLELSLVDLPWQSSSAPPGTKISYGIEKAFTRLLKIKDGSGRTAMDFLNGIGARNEIMVTGHSLGGCLTTVMALYLKDTLKGLAVRQYPFAGQTAGNSQFATWSAGTFGSTNRWANHFDIVPMAWNKSTLENIKKLYPDGGPKCDIWCDGAVDLALYEAGSNYFQPGTGTSLAGQLYMSKTFVEEIEAQHDHIYYMYLTGIPLRVIQGTPFHPGLGSGWWPPGHKKQP